MSPMTEMITTKLTIPPDVPMVSITGIADELLRLIQDSFSAKISLQGSEISITGSEADREALVTLFSEMAAAIQSGQTLDSAAVRNLMGLTRSAHLSPSSLRQDVILAHKGRVIRPKTEGQKRYVDAVRDHDITFAVGCAGTGKTYLAMALAVAALERKEVDRLIFSRPIVEAGENLGFLPGTLTEKVDPYIRPLYDALFAMMDADRAGGLIERGIIEIAPLAFMRGRTLSSSFIILDEAQNATREQMKMFLTRLGSGSKMVITGDMSQSDLSGGASGLRQALDVLQGIEEIALCRLDGKDVVRNSLVSQIIAAYEAHASKE